MRSALTPMREIRTPRSVGTGGGRPPPVTRWMWKRSHGRTSEAPPDERGGYRYVRPTATASHLDSTQEHQLVELNHGQSWKANVELGWIFQFRNQSDEMIGMTVAAAGWNPSFANCAETVVLTET